MQVEVFGAQSEEELPVHSIVFKIEEKIQQVIVETVGEPNDSYEDFTNSLPANECRYAVFDFNFTTNENCQKSKIFFIAW